MNPPSQLNSGNWNLSSSAFRPPIPMFKTSDVVKILSIALVVALGMAHILYSYQNSSLRFSIEAMESFEKKDLSLAETNLKKVLVKNPTDPWSYFNLAVVSALAHKNSQALFLYETLLKELKKNPIQVILFSRYNQAMIFGSMGYLRAALNKYQTALKINRPFKYINKLFFKRWDTLIKKNIELLMKAQELKSRQSQKFSQNQQISSANDEDNRGQKPSSEKTENQQTSSAKAQNDRGQTQENSSRPEEETPPSRPQEKRSDLNENQAPSSEKNIQMEWRSPLDENPSDSALLKEAEKQEGQARRRFYGPKPGPQNKPNKDW